MEDKETQMVYAPVVIITCNRVEHLKRCIESLADNSYAGETELYISVDYPPSEKYVDGWKRVCDYLKNEILGFKGVKIFFQDQNLGPARNADFLYKKAYEVYDRLIITEDDNIFAQDFIEYVDKGLMLFKDDQRVFGICGYAHAYHFEYSDENVMGLMDFNMWGCGLWRDKEKVLWEQASLKIWKEKSRNVALMYHIYKNRKRLFSRMLGTLLDEHTEENLDITDINRGIILALNGWYTVNPTFSKVRNCGWDGSGLNIGGSSEKREEYEKQEIDSGRHFEYRYRDVTPLLKNNQQLDANGEWNSERAKWYNDPLAYILYRILGRKNYFRYIRKVEIS